MSAKYFIDTNIFVYTFDSDAAQKKSIANDLIRSALLKHRGCISYQVIQEFLNVSSRKFAVPLKLNDAQKYLQNILSPICEVFSSIALYDRALEIMERWQYAFYDSLIIAAAVQADCRVLYSEDLQHYQKIQSTTIINPFL